MEYDLRVKDGAHSIPLEKIDLQCVHRFIAGGYFYRAKCYL